MPIKIDNIIYKVSGKTGLTILQFCYLKRILLPCFCYHENLSIAGNCRMCLVQINKTLGVSCALALDNAISISISIITDNKRVRESRENVLEFLLSNHPLDCPICDQAGECDLQDISLIYGTDKGRFYEYLKRSVNNLNLGTSLIKTVMTRCIHCTRCVRFASEITDFALGIMGRGLEMEIGSYVEISLQDELSGNIIDLCPVGALTSMPYAFKARPWELIQYFNIDFLDALASSLRIYVYYNEIKRILPIFDININSAWLTNKARFSYDTFLINRLNYPKVKINNKLVVFSWKIIITFFMKLLSLNKDNNFIAILGKFNDLRSVLSLKLFFNAFGCSNIFYSKISWVYDLKYGFLLNTSIIDLEIVNFILFIATNLRLENPLLNSRIRKNYLNNEKLIIYSLGLAIKYLTYPVKNLGNNVLQFFYFIKGKLKSFYNMIFFNLNSFSFFNFDFFFLRLPLFLIGMSVLSRMDSKSFFNCFFLFFNKKFSWLNCNIISQHLGFLSFSEFGGNLKTKIKKKCKSFFFILEDDHFNYENDDLLVYLGSLKPSSLLFSVIKIILPVTSIYEKEGVYLNLEGRYRFMRKVIYSSLNEDWEIIQILNIYNKKTNYLNNIFSILNNFFFIMPKFIYYINYNCIFFYSLYVFYSEILFFIGFFSLKNLTKHLVKFFNYIKPNVLKFQNMIFNSFIKNYYSGDIFINNSKALSISAHKNKIINWCT